MYLTVPGQIWWFIFQNIDQIYQWCCASLHRQCASSFQSQCKVLPNLKVQQSCKCLILCHWLQTEVNNVQDVLLHSLTPANQDVFRFHVSAAQIKIFISGIFLSHSPAPSSICQFFACLTSRLTHFFMLDQGIIPSYIISSRFQKYELRIIIKIIRPRHLYINPFEWIISILSTSWTPMSKTVFVLNFLPHRLNRSWDGFRFCNTCLRTLAWGRQQKKQAKHNKKHPIVVDVLLNWGPEARAPCSCSDHTSHNGESW